jgi:acetyl esterase/lipase
MRRFLILTICIAAFVGIGYLRGQLRPFSSSAPNTLVPTGPTLAESRKGFTTKLSHQIRDGTPLDQPPRGIFTIVKYGSQVGDLSAYLTPNPADGKKHPAIVWITGGDCNTIGDVWSPRPADNDQSAAPYRQAGIVMMFPSLRGGNQNPGVEEKFLGEVDDVIAAADYLAKQPYVDPARIYLGGHSTGGTLALLVSESTDRFRTVFSFGPVSTINAYGPPTVDLPFDVFEPSEVYIRSPSTWLWCIKSPTFVFEGKDEPSNADSVDFMSHSKLLSPAVHFHLINGTTHFSILTPMNRLIAQKILKDDGPTTNIDFSDADLAGITAQ